MGFQGAAPDEVRRNRHVCKAEDFLQEYRDGQNALFRMAANDQETRRAPVPVSSRRIDPRRLQHGLQHGLPWNTVSLGSHDGRRIGQCTNGLDEARWIGCVGRRLDFGSRCVGVLQQEHSHVGRIADGLPQERREWSLAKRSTFSKQSLDFSLTDVTLHALELVLWAHNGVCQSIADDDRFLHLVSSIPAASDSATASSPISLANVTTLLSTCR